MTTQELIERATTVYGTEQDSPLYQLIRQVAWTAEAKGKTVVADTYTKFLAEQKKRALQSRYYHHALDILGLPAHGYIHIPGYQEHHEIGSWEAPEIP
jgi:glutathione peroxidase-family protein